MPRAKTSGDRYAEQGRRTTKSAGVAGEAIRGAGVEVLLAAEAGERTALAALQRLALWDEGWLRAVSHDFGALYFLKFKFSRGKYAGGYVFYRCDDFDYTSALWGLCGKVEAVYAGTLRPTPDHAYE